MTENERAPGSEVFRYSRDGDVRIYSLRVVAGGTELWRVTVVPGEPDSAILEEHFKTAEVAGQYFEEIDGHPSPADGEKYPGLDPERRPRRNGTGRGEEDDVPRAALLETASRAPLSSKLPENDAGEEYCGHWGRHSRIP